MSDIGEPHKKPLLSSNFISSDADLSIISSDGIEFRVHSRYLALHSGAFPVKDVIRVGKDPINLTETAEVLEIFFQYIYPRTQPDLSQVPFKTLVGLAEAVEKYQIYAATRVCSLYMGMRKSEYPLDVLCYAGRHGHHNLVDEVAYLTIDTPIEEAFSMMQPNLFIAWVRYVGFWQSIVSWVTSVFEIPSHNHFDNTHLTSFGSQSRLTSVESTSERCASNAALVKFKGSLNFLTPSTLTTTSATGFCPEDSHCSTALKQLDHIISRKITEIPKVSTLMVG